MIPVRLTMQGIYSYQKEQTIDFAHLSSAGLFGIFGPVGSGKSAILEAISFALFNKIDRLSGDRRNYNMMNLRSDRLYIDFEFMANNGMTYRIEVTGRRNKRNFSDVPTFKRSFYSLGDDTWIPLDETTAERVTGLSYDNFHRTIIIPQGRFQEFLQLNVKDRVTMLKELFNLNRYDLSDKTSILERENNEKLQNLEGQMLQIGEIKPEDIAALKEEIREVQKSLVTLAELLKTAQIRDKELENLKKLSEELARQKEKLTVLQDKELKFSSMEKEVKEYETLYLAFHSDIEQLAALKSTLEKQTVELSSNKEKHDRYSSERSARQNELDALIAQYEKREDLLKQAEELKKLSQVLCLEDDIRRITLEIQKEKDDLKDLEKDILAGKDLLKLSTEQLGLRKKNLPDLKVLSEIKNWFRENKALTDQISGEGQSLYHQTEKLNSGRKEAFRISGSLITVDNSPESFDHSECIVLIEEAKAEIENSLRHLQPEISELEIQKRLEKFAGELQEGKPCPLCGSEVHPHILDIHDVSEKLESIRRRKEELEAEIKKFTKGEKELSSLLKEITLTEKQVKIHQQNIEDLISKQQLHRKKFIWEQFSHDKEQAVDEEMIRYDTLGSEIRNLESGIDELNKSITGKEARREDLSNRIRISDNKIAEHTAGINLLVSQIVVTEKDEWQGQSIRDLELKEAWLRKEHKSLSEKYKLLEEQVRELRSLTDTLNGTIESVTWQVETTKNQKEQLSEKIAVKLAQHGGIELGYVAEVIKKDIDLNPVKKEIAAFRAELEAAKNQLFKLQGELDSGVYPEREHKELKEQLTLLQTRTDEKNQLMGKLKISLSVLEKNFTDLEILKKEQALLLIRGNNLVTLKNLFRGAAFVNFASRAYLENIVLAANIRFRKLTRQHLELVLDEDNNFMIRDHMNEGRLRSVKTLSGGQTFQASLSLALALADNVNRQVQAGQNFFFLDEGFGSLDRESLGIVFETLKSLRKENRIVGVISHVEEMQQEIDVHLVVSIDDADGSTIRSSWY